MASATGSCVQKRSAPAGAREFPPPQPGLALFVTRLRWLAPPANFRGVSGSSQNPVFKNAWYDITFDRKGVEKSLELRARLHPAKRRLGERVSARPVAAGAVIYGERERFQFRALV